MANPKTAPRPDGTWGGDGRGDWPPVQSKGIVVIYLLVLCLGCKQPPKHGNGRGRAFPRIQDDAWAATRQEPRPAGSRAGARQGCS